MTLPPQDNQQALNPPGAGPPAPHPPPAPLLSVRGVYKHYRDFPAVQDVTFSVAPGEIVGLVGPNGAGKTTILRCIAGVLRPTGGEILCGGYSMTQAPAQAKPLLSLIPETPDLYELLTATEHLRFIHMAYGETSDFPAQAEQLLRYLDLWEKKDALVATLSKGMKQKLAVACAFIHSSRVFLFDEPFIGVDPAGQRAVREMVRHAADQGAAVVISSHILDTVEQLCARVLVLNRGRLLAEGNLEQLRLAASMGEDGSLEDVFLTLTTEAPRH